MERTQHEFLGEAVEGPVPNFFGAECPLCEHLLFALDGDGEDDVREIPVEGKKVNVHGRCYDIAMGAIRPGGG